VAFVGVADTGWPVMTDRVDTVGQPVAERQRDEHVGFGRVGAVVASVPDRVALLVLCGSLVVTAMLQFKVFNPYAAVVATVVAFAGTWRVLPTRDNPTDQRSVLGVVVAVEVVAAWVWVNAPYYAQELSVLNFPRFDGHPRLASWSGRECPKWDVHRSTAKSSGPTRLRWS